MLMWLFISEYVSQISAVDVVAIVDVMLAFAKILSNFISFCPHCSRHGYLHREVVKLKLKCIHYEHVVCYFPLISNCLTIGLYLFILKCVYIYGSILVLDMCPSCKVLVVARLFVLSGTQTKMCQNAYSIRQMTVYQLDLMKVISHGTQLKKV